MLLLQSTRAYHEILPEVGVSKEFDRRVGKQSVKVGKRDECSGNRRPPGCNADRTPFDERDDTSGGAESSSFIASLNTEVKPSYYPMVTLSSPHLIKNCVFMIDSGSGVNLIKQSSLISDVLWEDTRAFTLQGISSLSVQTLGSVLLTLMGRPTLFHVVTDSVGFAQEGILGNRFLQDHAASVDYKNKYLHYDNAKIPFAEITIIKITERSVSPFYVNVTNPEIQYGYIPLTTPIKGLYYGNAIVTNVNGKAYLPIINTNEINYKLEIPSIHWKILI